MALGALGVVAETQVPHVFEPLTPLLFGEPREASPIQFSIMTRVFFTLLRLFNVRFDELYCGVCYLKTCCACLCLMIHGVLYGVLVFGLLYTLFPFAETGPKSHRFWHQPLLSHCLICVA